MQNYARKQELLRHSRELRKNMTDAEQKLWYQIRGRQLNGHRFRRQMVIGQYIVDFCCPQEKLVVELDGGQHQQAENYDNVRSQCLESQGYRVLRFWNHQVLQQLDAVLEQIQASM